jgi:hypothetical protein
MSKTCSLPEVEVEIDECRLLQSLGWTIQPLPNSGVVRYSRATRGRFLK